MLPDRVSAIYFSIHSYTTLGASSVTLPDQFVGKVIIEIDRPAIYVLQVPQYRKYVLTEIPVNMKRGIVGKLAGRWSGAARKVLLLDDLLWLVPVPLTVINRMFTVGGRLR